MVQLVCCMWGEGEQRAPNERNYAKRAFAYRIAQLQLCTGKYHCPMCLPKGHRRANHAAIITGGVRGVQGFYGGAI